MDTTEYTEKMMLKDETYKAITKDPTNRVETKVTTAQNSLRKTATYQRRRESTSPHSALPHNRSMAY
jgi:hypothetical protein